MTMFCKYLGSSLRSRLHLLTDTPAALYPPFHRIILLKLSRLSTTIAGNDKPTGYPEAENTCPVSEFLLNKCGLRQSELSAILKIRPSLLAKGSTHRAEQAVQLLRDSGFTEDQVRKAITRIPAFLTFSVDRQLKPKIEFIRTLGLTEQDLGKVISNGPRLLTCNLEKTLCPNVRYLQKLLGSDVSKVFKEAPYTLPKRNGPEFWETKFKHFASFGLLEDEIKELVRRYPFILNVSIDKVQKNMDFFRHTARLPAKFLFSNPMPVFGYSLEARIKPRYKVLSAISAMQPSKRLPSLISAITLSEKKFLEKYVQCSSHATKLLEIYSDKPSLS